MSTLGQLRRALRDIESSMPPPLLALHYASPAVRAAYAAHRERMAEWHRAQGPNAYALWLDGQIEPPEPPTLLHRIFPPMRVLRRGEDVADAWRTALEGARCSNC